MSRRRGVVDGSERVRHIRTFMKYGVGLNVSYSRSSCSGKLYTAHCMSELRPTRNSAFWLTTSSRLLPAAVMSSTCTEHVGTCVGVGRERERESAMRQ